MPPTNAPTQRLIACAIRFLQSREKLWVLTSTSGILCKNCFPQFFWGNRKELSCKFYGFYVYMAIESLVEIVKEVLSSWST